MYIHYAGGRGQALASILRSQFVVWRRIVTGLSARRRLATFVLATRLRLAHALELWSAAGNASSLNRALIAGNE